MYTDGEDVLDHLCTITFVTETVFALGGGI